MFSKIVRFLDRAIWFSYLSLVIITPLLFSTQNSELFEVPKMLFVYLATSIIFFMTLLKFVLNGKILIPKNLAFLSLVFFVAVQIISTFTSIDKFTSIFGYPTRLNGGLLSQFAYLLIFAGILVNLNYQKAKQLTVATVVAAFVVSLWGIPAHFGHDPSCFVLTGKLTSSCWQKDFDPTLRIFSTLGQPNWLASYLVLVIPFSLAFILGSKTVLNKFLFSLISATLFLALVFTTSRAGAIGFISSILIFAILLGTNYLKRNFKIIGPMVVILLSLAAIFGTTYFSRFNESVKRISSPLGGTESGQIRLIVWRGAIEIFKKRPLLGWGPETFAYSYYLYRPLEHNNTTEWNFFYNKAHNEFLNYLANIGILGASTYTIFIFTTLITLFSLAQNKETLSVLTDKQKTGKPKSENRQQRTENRLLAKATLASILGYQLTIFFGFSVVTTQLLMYSLIALALLGQKSRLAVKSQNLTSIDLKFFKKTSQIICGSLITLVGLWTLTLVLRLYFADLFLSRAQNTSTSGRSIGLYINASNTFPTKNPFYFADTAYELAQYAANSPDPQRAPANAQEAIIYAQQAEKLSPNNLIITRRIANAYFLLANISQTYEKNAIEGGTRLIKLAPTDPQSYLSLAKIQAGLDLKKEAEKSLEKALELKPDYREAKELLEQIENKQLTTDN